jgi:hypothetical protein
MRFFYRPTLAFAPSGLTFLYQPVISVLVLGPQGSDLLLAMVDTGSDDVILPRSLAPTLGVTVDDTQAIPVTGVTGHQSTFAPGGVELEISDGVETYRWAATARFLSFPDPQRQLAMLGHSGCLEYFTATFDGYKKELHLTPNANFPGVIHQQGSYP